MYIYVTIISFLSIWVLNLIVVHMPYGLLIVGLMTDLNQSNRRPVSESLSGILMLLNFVRKTILLLLNHSIQFTDSMNPLTNKITAHFMLIVSNGLRDHNRLLKICSCFWGINVKNSWIYFSTFYITFCYICLHTSEHGILIMGYDMLQNSLPVLNIIIFIANRIHDIRL